MQRKLLPLLALSVWAVAVSAGTLIVDGDGSADFSTIQSAVDAAQPGDTVLVQPGTYQESVVIENKTDLTLRGTHRDSVRVLREEGAQQEPVVLLIYIDSCEGLVLGDMTIDGSSGRLDIGVAVESSADVTVRNTLMTSMGSSFVAAGRSHQLTVTGNEFVIGPEVNQIGFPPRFLDLVDTPNVRFGRNHGSWDTPPSSSIGGGSSYPALRIRVKTSADIMSYRVWGNRLSRGHDVTLNLWIDENLEQSGYRLDMADNKWGEAQSRDELKVNTGLSCGGALEFLVDPVRTILSAEPAGDEPLGGVFRDNVFPSANIIVAHNPTSSIDPCRYGASTQVILTPVSPSTWGDVKRLMR